MQNRLVFRVVLGLLLAGAVVPDARGGDSGSPGLLFAAGAEVEQFRVAAETQTSATIRWSSSIEQGINGFLLTRTGVDGLRETVGFQRSEGYGDGAAYVLEDSAAQLGDELRYDLFLISKGITNRIRASWEGTVEAAVESPVRMALAEPVVLAALAAEPQFWIGNGDRVGAWTEPLPADRVRLSLTQEGIYRVTAEELALAGGWELGVVSNAIVSTNLSLSCQGQPVAWLADNDVVLFHGLPPVSRFAPENVYWVELGSGPTILTVERTLSEPASTNQWFLDTVLFQGIARLSAPSYCSLVDMPTFLGETLVFAEGSKPYTQELMDPAAGEWAGSVNLNLASWYEVVESDIHEVQVSVGDIPVGQSTWTGEQFVAVSFPFAATNLLGANATITVANVAPDPPDDDFTRFEIMSYGYTYARQYLARENALRCSGGASNRVSIAGFSTNDLLVLDVTPTNLPVAISPVELFYDGTVSNWSATFPCGDSNHIYYAVSRATGCQQPSIRGVRNVDWSSVSNAMDYAILIPPEGWMTGFRIVAQELADFREKQGLITKVVDVESIYNQFSHGLVDAGAIQQFCAAGRSHWGERPLRYLLLAADGTIDFKHDKYTVGDDEGWFIPTFIARQRFSTGEGMIAAIDAAMGDVDGDGVPDVAVGRIPTGLSTELQIVVDKTLAYEGAFVRTNGLLAKSYALLAADWNNTGSLHYPFSTGLDHLIAPLETAGRVHVPARADPADPTNLAAVKTGILFPELKQGTGLFHFFGHSNRFWLGYDGGSNKMLYYNDFASEPWHPTVGVIMGCHANVWHWMTPSVIVPKGLFEPNGGFAAALGAAGYLLADEGELLADNMYSAAAEEGLLRLGDILNAGFRRTVANPLNPDRLGYPNNVDVMERMQCLSLVGDPALIIRHDVTHTGTDVEWLVENGLTNANADVEDVDGDGWETWREYLDDTNPTGNTLQVVDVDTHSGAPMIAFETRSTNSYRVEYKPRLNSSNAWETLSWSAEGTVWSPAETQLIPSGPIMSVLLPESTIQTQGFFRVSTAE